MTVYDGGTGSPRRMASGPKPGGTGGPAPRILTGNVGWHDMSQGTANPAHRHGGPGAGWYVPGPDGWQRITDAEAADQRYPDMAHFMHDPRTVTVMATDQELTRRAAAAWERHNAEPRISGGPDGLRQEFMAGYCAREAELGEPDGTDEAPPLGR